VFTSLRSRLWLSYAVVITIALFVVTLVVLAFLLRNPLVTRQTQERLKTAENTILADQARYLENPDDLRRIQNVYDVRIIVLNAERDVLFDSNPDDPQISFPRRPLLSRAGQTVRDESGQLWLYTFKRVSRDNILIVAAPRPRVPVLNVFTDQFLVPVLEGGLIALALSLILAFAISRWVADPLQEVVHAAQRYPDGELKSILPTGPHEVQDLTRAFNSMITRVESSQKSQRDFVANVSHELKTPLTSIQGFAQAILDGTADTPEARTQAAQIIYNEAGRMHRMALDLLDLAKLEGGTADLNMSRVDVKALLETIVEKFSPQARRVGIHLQLNVPSNLPSLIGDGDRLAQVFTNLTDNALKFTPAEGQVILSAATAGAEMQISITDSGVGVPKEALPRLFDRFYQVDPSRAGGESHGAGLGLAIVREIIQAHNGKISVRSEVGHGTTFVIHLPLA
jgi:signal transduction histidine kinase